MFEVDHPLIEIISPSEIFILEDNSKIIFIDFYPFLIGNFNYRFLYIDLFKSSYSNDDLWFNDTLISSNGLKIKYKYIPLKDKINLL